MGTKINSYKAIGISILLSLLSIAVLTGVQKCSDKKASAPPYLEEYQRISNSIDSLSVNVRILKELVKINDRKGSLTIIKYRPIYEKITITPDSLQLSITKELLAEHSRHPLERGE